MTEGATMTTVKVPGDYRPMLGSLSELIRALIDRRQELGLSQQEVAERMGRSQQVVGQFERLARVPTVEKLARHADAVGMTLTIALDQSAGKLPKLIRILADRRKDLGLSQQEVARRMRTTQPVVAKVEGLVNVPTVGTLARYAEAVGMTLTLTVERAASRAERTGLPRSP